MKRNRSNRKHKHQRGSSGPPPHLAASAAQEAMRRATLAAAAGKLTAADREMRLAERMDKLGRSPFLFGAPANAEEDLETTGEEFRRELEHRINRFREAERAELDRMKRKDPARWQAEFDAAVEKAVDFVREFWTGDPRMFEEDDPSPPAPNPPREGRVGDCGTQSTGWDESQR